MSTIQALLVAGALLLTTLLSSGCALLLVPAAGAIGVGVGMEVNQVRKGQKGQEATDATQRPVGDPAGEPGAGAPAR